MTLAPPLSGNLLRSDSFVLAEWRDQGGPPGPPRLIAPLHVHFEDDEAWVVLEGSLCVRVGDDVFEARTGSAVLAPRGKPHTFWNPGPGPVRYLLVMTPRIDALIRAIHATTDRSRDAMRALFRRHASDLVEAAP
jgi:mannose-6-phosphate isomerase-like protein (cupin superfamily)